MSDSKTSPLQRLITRASRRLFIQVLVSRMGWCLSGALVLSVAWFFLQPFLLTSPPEWVRWSVAGGLAVLGMALAFGFTFWTAPSRLAAALELDDRFDLKERVTTSLTLTPDLAATPAGVALIEDTHKRVASLDVGSKFPVRLSWAASIVPALIAVLLLVAMFFPLAQAPGTKAKGTVQAKTVENKAQIDRKMEDLKKKKTERKAEDRPKSEELQRIEAELDKIASKPRDTKDQLRERVREMTELEEKMKERQKDLASRSQAMKNQLKQLDKNSKAQDGPANEMQKAISEGNLDKAKDELDKLTKKIKENQLSQQDKKKLAEQMKEMEDKLKSMADQEEKKDQLKKLAKEGKIDADTLKREMDRLDKEAEKTQKKMQDLANKMGKCKKCMEDGDAAGASEGLQGAKEDLENMQADEKELDDLNEQLQRLQDAKEAADGDGEGGGRRPGEPGEPKDGNMGQGGGQPGGKRKVGDKTDTKAFDAKQKADFDPKGKKIADGFAPGKNFKSKPGAEIAGDIKQAAQEAPEAIEQQRIPKGARDMAKGYFQNLGGQDNKPGKSKTPDEK